MAIDSFIVNLPDSDRNARTFGYPQAGPCPGSQSRRLGFWRCARSARTFSTEPRSSRVTGRSSHGRLVVAFFAGKHAAFVGPQLSELQTLGQVLEAEAHLLARIRSTLIFKPIRRLQDGSFLAKLYRTPYDRKIDRGGVKVRIIEYTFRDPGRPGSGEKHRPLTTLLDAARPSGQDADRAVPRALGRRARPRRTQDASTAVRTLRSQTPAGVVQEIYGLLLGHYVIRKLMWKRPSSDVSPRRICRSRERSRSCDADCPRARRVRGPAALVSDLAGRSGRGSVARAS